MEYPARVLFRGHFGPSDIETQQINLSPLPVNIQARVDSNWATELRKNPDLKPGRLLVATGVELSEGKLVLRCGESNYPNFKGTTSSEDVPEAHRHRAIGVLAVTTTSDNYVLLGVRAPRKDWGLLRHVVPAGRLQPDENDPFSGITAEFREELGLTVADIVDLHCIGVVADLVWARLNVEFVFRATTRCSAREVMESAKAAVSADEHCHLEPFPWQPSLMRDLLLADPNGYVPTGWAGLVIALQSDFGLSEFTSWEPRHRTYDEHVWRHARLIKDPI